VPQTRIADDLGWPNILRRNERLEITAATRPVWDATPVDYGEIVDVLVRAEIRHDEICAAVVEARAGDVDAHAADVAELVAN
jgi:hypothetical protein